MMNFPKDKLKLFLSFIILSVIIPLISGAFGAYYFDSKINQKDAQRNFIYNFNRTFFDNPKYRDISIALEEQYLYGKGKIFQINGGMFNDYQVDDFLGILHDFYLYGESNLVAYSLIDNEFSYYLCIVYINDEIIDYRERLKKLGFS